MYGGKLKGLVLALLLVISLALFPMHSSAQPVSIEELVTELMIVSQDLEQGQTQLEQGYTMLEAGEIKLEAGQSMLKLRLTDLNDSFNEYKRTVSRDRNRDRLVMLILAALAIIGIAT